MPDSSPSATSGRPAQPATEAARWFARRDAGWTVAEQAACARWRAADARHEEEWQRLCDAMDFVAAQRDADERGAIADELAHRQRHRRRRRAALATAGLAAAAVAAVFIIPARPRPATAGDALARIQVSQPERRSLPDGSSVELARGAEVRVAYSGARREVRLLRGEAHFAVAKDAARPFIVTTGDVEVRAVGTEFAVRVADAAVRVLVTEGRIAVGQPRTAAATACFADAGTRVTIAPGAAAESPLVAEPLTPADLEREQAWRQPTIDLGGAALAEVAQVFNRANPIQLRIVDPKLAGMRLTGVFRADQPLALVQVLEAHYGVSATRTGLEVELRPAR